MKFRSERPNNSFKPNLLRYTKAMAEKACHGFGSTTQVGLTQALGVGGEMTDKRVFLESIRQENRSSPAGIHWENFRKHLVGSARTTTQSKLPNPLILGGDIASHAEKHRRLEEQLDWAEQHGCLAEAIHFLEALPASAWNQSSGRDWNEEHPWARGEW